MGFPKGCGKSKNVDNFKTDSRVNFNPFQLYRAFTRISPCRRFTCSGPTRIFSLTHQRFLTEQVFNHIQQQSYEKMGVYSRY